MAMQVIEWFAGSKYVTFKFNFNDDDDDNDGKEDWGIDKRTPSRIVPVYCSPTF